MVLPGMRARESLDEFHDRCLHLKEEEIESKSEVIKELASHFRQQRFLKCHSVSEVRKGGSLGKKTAVNGQSDVDLVVFLNNLDGMDEFRLKRPRILRNMKLKLRNGFPRLAIKRQTPYSLQCRFRGQDVDILPAINIKKKELGSVFRKIKDASDPEDESQNYSASLTKFQIRFVYYQRETVKRVIRLVKYWKEKRKLDIPSYTVELITIEANEVQGDAGDTKELFLAVLEYLADADCLQVDFDKHYQPQKFLRTGEIEVPYVLDPANPFKNTLAGCDVYATMTAARELWSRCRQYYPYL